jgi:hypothetical protein
MNGKHGKFYATEQQSHRHEALGALIDRLTLTLGFGSGKFTHCRHSPLKVPFQKKLITRNPAPG